MNTYIRKLCLAALLAAAFAIESKCQVPGIISYQGQVRVNGTNLTGTGQFKFSLLVVNINLSRQAKATASVTSGFVIGYTVTDGGAGYTSVPTVTITDTTGSGATATANISGGVVTNLTPGLAGSGYSPTPTVTIASPPLVFDTLWSNDGTGVQGGEPTAGVSTTVNGGLFTVLLGNNSLQNMTPIPVSVFARSNVFLRIWFDDGSHGVAQLSPEQLMVSAGYAMRAAIASAVDTNSVGSNELKNGAVTAGKLAPGVIPTSLPPNGAAGGDLSGSYPNPTIAPGAVSGNKIADQGVGFSQISRSGAAAGEVLNYDGSTVAWRADRLQLPFSTSGMTSSGSQFALIDTNNATSGELVRLDVQHTNSAIATLRLTTAAHGQNGIDASTTGGGSVAFFHKSVDRATGGGTFIGPVIVARSQGQSTVTAAEFSVANTNATSPAVDIQHDGTGVALQVDATGTNIAVFRRRTVAGGGGSSTIPVVRFDSTGKGFFDGGTQTGGADIAEAFDVEGNRENYEPGDVLVISTSRSRQMTRSSNPYSTLVAGVVATKPGVLLTEETNSADLSQQVPLGMTGVIPTKVCSRNGPIRIGDLLVTSSIPGHAMKGNPAVIKERPGCVLGKALDNFDGAGRGMIRVLVNVQ